MISSAYNKAKNFIEKHPGEIAYGISACLAAAAYTTSDKTKQLEWLYGSAFFANAAFGYKAIFESEKWTAKTITLAGAWPLCLNALVCYNLWTGTPSAPPTSVAPLAASTPSASPASTAPLAASVPSASPASAAPLAAPAPVNTDFIVTTTEARRIRSIVVDKSTPTKINYDYKSNIYSLEKVVEIINPNDATVVYTGPIHQLPYKLRYLLPPGWK